MRKLVIARLGTDNKVAYDAAGNRFFVPDSLRSEIKIGMFASTIVETFNNRTNDKGELEECDPWQRESISVVNADKKAFLNIVTGDMLLDAEAKLHVANETKQMAETYGLSAEELKAVW